AAADLDEGGGRFQWPQVGEAVQEGVFIHGEQALGGGQAEWCRRGANLPAIVFHRQERCAHKPASPAKIPRSFRPGRSVLYLRKATKGRPSAGRRSARSRGRTRLFVPWSACQGVSDVLVLVDTTNRAAPLLGRAA